MLLFQQEGKIISREDLCMSMWNREKANSSMSQLSVMVKSLRKKVSAQNIKGPIIKIYWGQSYILNESVYEQVYVDAEELKYADD